jgi:hypothetical protein
MVPEDSVTGSSQDIRGWPSQSVVAFSMYFTPMYEFPPSGTVVTWMVLYILVHESYAELYEDISATQAAAYSGPEPVDGSSVLGVLYELGVAVATSCALPKVAYVKMAASTLAGSSKEFIMS